MPRNSFAMLVVLLVSNLACSGLFDLPSDTSTGSDIGSWPDVDLDVDDAWGELPDGVSVSDLVTNDRVCLPQCYYKVCGSDGCGGLCGKCGEGTSCSSDQTMCIPESVQVGLGERCEQTDWCAPLLTNLSGYTYTNSDWPDCLDDQCLEGACIFGVCSRACEIRVDVIVNGTNVPLDDGIEDFDAEDSDCNGGNESGFPAGFACVATSPVVDGPSVAGVCIPKSSFTPCSGGEVCPSGETCGYLPVRGSLEARCLVDVPDGRELGDSCGFNTSSGVTKRCNSWNCSANGCTSPCDEDADCLSDKARCDPETLKCDEGGQDCSVDADCSAWMCRSAIAIDELDYFMPACGPRKCIRDVDCRDPQFYCHHDAYYGESGTYVFNGWCRPLTKGGADVGAQCRVDPDDALPDVVCSHGDYCLDGRCSAMCSSSDDCPDDNECGMRVLPAMMDAYGNYQTEVLVPVCVHLGAESLSCEIQADCLHGTCTPWIEYAGEGGSPVGRLSCAVPPDGAEASFALCGAGAYGAICANRQCLGEVPADLTPGLCSIPCRTIEDCPTSTPLGADIVGWVCEATALSDMGTGSLADDVHVSWCVPVPGGSSLEFCGNDLSCAAPAEVCRAFARAGLPGGESQVDYRCVEITGTLGLGEICDPFGDGAECMSGICTPTKEGGQGVCSRLCGSEQDCVVMGNDFSCRDRVEIPRNVPEEDVTISQCTMSGKCVVCGEDRDCSDGYSCINASGLYYYTDRRCAKACVTDADCQAEGEGITCIEATGIPLTTPATKKMVCGLPVCG